MKNDEKPDNSSDENSKDSVKAKGHAAMKLLTKSIANRRLKKPTSIDFQSGTHEGKNYIVADDGKKISVLELQDHKRVKVDTIIPPDVLQNFEKLTIDIDKYDNSKVFDYKSSLFYQECMKRFFGNDEVQFIHSEDENNYIMVTSTFPPFHIPLGSADGMRKLKYHLYKYYNAHIKSTELKDYYDYLTELVKTEIKPIIQEPRAFRINDTIYYDLNDKESPKYIEINKDNYSVKEGSHICFRKSPIQDTQPVPKAGGSIDLLDKYLVMDDEKKYLLKIYILCAFIPGFEHPILLIEGEAKSGKSTLSYILKRLIDPTTSGILRMPDNMESLILNLDQHYFVPYDNMPTKIKDSISDTLCQAVTGIGIEVRKLYTDSDIISRHFKRAILLNGITLGVLKNDLHRRILSIELKKMDPNKTSESIKDDFEKDRALILGAVFTIISKALKILSEAKDINKNLSDFQKYGYACAEALGTGNGDKFLKLYKKQVEDQDSRAAYDNQLATAIMKLMEDKQVWPADGDINNGTMEKLRVALQNTAAKPGLDYLKSVANLIPNQLSKTLNSIIGLLDSQGITVTQQKRKADLKSWVIVNENFNQPIDDSQVDPAPAPAEPKGIVFPRKVKNNPDIKQE